MVKKDHDLQTKTSEHHQVSQIKPHFIPMGNDFLAAKRAKLVDYLDEEELEREEQERIDMLNQDHTDE